MSGLVAAPVVIPLAGAALALGLSKWVNIERVFAFIAMGTMVATSVGLLVRVSDGSILVFDVGGWQAPVGITLVVDAFAAVMLTVSAVTLLVVHVYAMGSPRTADHGLFHPLYLVMAAGVAASTVILLQGEEPTRTMRVALAVATYVLALLMVSTFRYWSFKEVDFARRRPVETLLVVVLAVMIVATMHEVFLFLVFGGYALSGPVRRVVMGRPPSPAPAEATAGKDGH